MGRSSASEMQTDALTALDEALAAHGLTLRQSKSGLVLKAPGEGERSTEVKAVSYASPELLSRFIQEGGGKGVRILVADAIPAAGKELLKHAGWGWFDRRGSLYLAARGLYINDSTIKSLPRIAAEYDYKPIHGRAGLSAAALLLMSPDEPPGVREIARGVGMAPSTISAALAAMRAASLLMQDGRALVPELFWELAETWHPRHVSLTGLPDLEDPLDVRVLRLGLRAGDEQGWVLTGTVAAAAWGAPIVASADYPPDFYVPSPGGVAAAIRRLGEAAWEQRSCSVAAAATAVVTARTFSQAKRLGPWPLAHPLFVALDLAQDAARGVEILREWTPPKPFARVW